MNRLTLKTLRIHGFKMANSIEHIVKNVAKFISPESVKNIAYVGKNTNKRKPPYDLLKTAKKT